MSEAKCMLQVPHKLYRHEAADKTLTQENGLDTSSAIYCTRGITWLLEIYQFKQTSINISKSPHHMRIRLNKRINKKHRKEAASTQSELRGVGFR